MFTSCSAFSFISFFVVFFKGLEKAAPTPPLRTTTLIQTRAPQQLHTQELGFCRMQLATISNTCAKQKGNWWVRSRTKRVKRCAESRRDPGRWKEKGGSDHLAHRASHLDTLRSEKSHTFLKVPVTIVFFFCPRSGCLIHSPFFSPSVALYKYIFDHFENFKLLWFLADQLSPSGLISPHKSL